MPGPEGGANRPGERFQTSGFGQTTGSAGTLRPTAEGTGKGGANRPGERRAADVLVEDSEVPHGLQWTGLGC